MKHVSTLTTGLTDHGSPCLLVLRMQLRRLTFRAASAEVTVCTCLVPDSRDSSPWVRSGHLRQCVA